MIFLCNLLGLPRILIVDIDLAAVHHLFSSFLLDLLLSSLYIHLAFPSNNSIIFLLS